MTATGTYIGFADDDDDDEGQTGLDVSQNDLQMIEQSEDTGAASFASDDALDGAVSALNNLEITTTELETETECLSDSEDDNDKPLIAFEKPHPLLLEIFKRSSPLFAGPELAVDRQLMPKPSTFFRVCDEETFAKFSLKEGFVNEIQLGLPAWPFIDGDSVVHHLNWDETPDRSSITRYISMCSTATKRNKEITWRQRKQRLVFV